MAFCPDCGKELTTANICPGCGYKCDKTWGGIINILLLVVGIVLLAVGIGMWSYHSSQIAFYNRSPVSTSQYMEALKAQEHIAAKAWGITLAALGGSAFIFGAVRSLLKH